MGLAGVVASSSCPNLQFLDVRGNKAVGDVVVAEVTRGLASGACTKELRGLTIKDTGWGDQTEAALHHVAYTRPWPQLKSLEIGFSRAQFDAVYLYLLVLGWLSV